MDQLSSNQRKAYEAIWQLRNQQVVTFDQIASRSGLKRTTAVKAIKFLEEKGVVSAVTVKGRRYRVKRLPVRPQ